jgi:beta-1,4-mannosyltransferase
MSAADIVVFPFKAIFNSGSVILAMSFAKPVIAPALGALREILDENGAIFANMHPDDLVEKMVAAQEMRETLPDMGHWNFSRVKPYSWDKIAALHLSVYDSIMNRISV